MCSDEVVDEEAKIVAGAATLGAVLPVLAQTGGRAMRRIGVLSSNPPSLAAVVPLWAACLAGMRCRTFGRIAAVLVGAIAIAASAAAAEAQLSSKQARVAVLSPFSPSDPGIDAFIGELARLGWIEGRNLELSIGFVHGRLERLPAMAGELLRPKPDVIFTPGEHALHAAKKVGTETPIVTVSCDRLDRLIVSLAAPGGTATGLSCATGELAGKRLATLKELLPSLARAVVLYNSNDPNKRLEFEQLEAAAERLRVVVRALEVVDATGIEEAFAAAASEHAEAMIVLMDAFTIFHRRRIADLALEHRLPSVFGFKEFVDAGGLLSYGASRGALFRRAAAYVDKILNGAKPGELPIEEPAIFELYINRQTADALGLTIPPNLLARADEVIE